MKREGHFVKLITFILFFLVNCLFAARVTSVHFEVINSAEDFNYSLNLKFQKGWFNKTKYDLKNLSANDTVYLEKLVKLKKVRFEVDIKSKRNIKFFQDHHLSLNGFYKHRKRKTKRHRVRFYTETKNFKFKPRLNCRSLLNFEYDKQTKRMKVTLDGLNSLADCDGKDLDNYSINSLGARKVGGGFPLNTISPGVDRFLGQSFSRSFVRKNRDVVLESGPLVDFLQKKMDLIRKNSDSLYKNRFTPKVRVINADVVNAFALPGGDIYVFTGLIEQSQDLDSLMGVLAHEWAHVAARHGVLRMLRAYAWIASGFLVDASLYTISHRNNWNRVVTESLRATGGLLIQSRLLGKSREAEAEADLLGSQYLYKSGHSPLGVATFFEGLQNRSPRINSQLLNTLSTHPHPLMRVEAGQLYASYFIPAFTEKTALEEEFLAIKKLVHQMPEAQGKKGSYRHQNKVAQSFVNHLEQMNHRFLMDQINNYIFYSGFYHRRTRNSALMHINFFNP